MEMTRRSFLAKVSMGAAALPLVAGKVSLADARMKVKVGYMKIVDCVPFLMGIEKGFFQQEGLDLEAVPFVGGAAIGPAVASGDLQIGFTGTTPFNRAKDAGLDFKWLVNGSLNEQWLYDADALMVLMGSPIRAPKDMVGKTLTTNTLFSMNHLFMIAYLAQHGIDPKGVNFVEAPFPQMEAALKAKRVDVISVHEPFVTVSVLRGVSHVISHNWSEVSPRFLIAGWYASEKWIKNNKEAAQAFIRGYNRGVDYASANLGEVRNAILTKYIGLSADLAQKVVMSKWEKTILLSDLRPVSDLSYEHKFTKRKITPEEQVSDLAIVG